MQLVTEIPDMRPLDAGDLTQAAPIEASTEDGWRVSEPARVATSVESMTRGCGSGIGSSCRIRPGELPMRITRSPSRIV